MFILDLSNFVVRPAGFEPAAYGFEVRRCINLSPLYHNVLFLD